MAGVSQKRNQLFAAVREGQNLVIDERFTQAYNVLDRAEKQTRNLHLLGKIAKMKIHCLLNVGNVPTATDYIRQLLVLHPRSGQINFIAASYFNQLGQQSKAGDLYLRAVNLAPDNIQYALNYAFFLKERNQPRNALGTLRRCLQLNRKSRAHDDKSLYMLYLELGQLYFSSGSYLRALTLFAHASYLRQHFPYFDLMAECYLCMNNYTEALRCIEMHLEHWGENDPEALFTYAKSLSGLGLKREALSALARCRDMWGELVITAADMTHLYPLVQDGSLNKIPDATIQI